MSAWIYATYPQSGHNMLQMRTAPAEKWAEPKSDLATNPDAATPNSMRAK
jgi:hypothetical protein